MSTATLNGSRVTRAEVQIPAWGIWYADVSVDIELARPTACTLQLADLTLVGTCLSGGPWAGGSRFRIVGGAGGWGKRIPARGYTHDGGVRLSLVLQDAAEEAGETIDPSTIPGTVLGRLWAREAGPASRVLQSVCSEAWHVGLDGVTRIGRRASATYAGRATVVRVDRATGTVDLAAESLADLVPGVTVEGIEAVDVQHTLEDQAIRTRIWGDGYSATSGRVSAMRRMVEQLLPGWRFRGIWEYRVVSQSGERLDLQAAKVSTGLPDLLRVPVRYGIPGARADVALGSLVLVAFVDGDPARPSVVGFDDPDSPGWMPTELDFGESPRLPLARMGDAVQAGPFSGVVVGGSSKVKAG